ncbi:MAG: GAF domain-containing protein [Limnothrix sp. RL_2_0]|nr:GAF domain-containing protein [Limnothrix sp. RL_2_0]
MITEQTLPPTSHREYIPPAALSTFTLEQTIRLLFNSGDRQSTFPPAPTATDQLQLHLKFTQVTVQFSQALSALNPNLETALSILGESFSTNRITIVQWLPSPAGAIAKPKILAQWSADTTTPSYDPITNIADTWLSSFIGQKDIVQIRNYADHPELQSQLIDQDIASLIAVPIHDETDAPWGHLILSNDYPAPQFHSEFAIHTLKIATELIHHYFVRYCTQRDLAASEALYSGIVLHSAEVIFLVNIDTEYNFIFEMVNPTYCEKTHLDESEIIGRSPEDIFPLPCAINLNKSFHACYKIGETLLLEEEYQFSQGQQIWRTCLIPIRDRLGQVIKIQGSARDVTQERHLEMAKIRHNRQQSLLASLTLKILESWQMEAMLATTVEELRKTFQADRVFFWELVDGQEGEVTAEAAINTIKSMLHQTFPMAAFDRGDFNIFYQGEIQICIDIDAAKFPKKHDQMLRTYGVVGYAVLPILVSSLDGNPNSEPILKGLICVQQCHTMKPWTTDELSFLRHLNHQICIAFNQAELIRRQQQNATELARSNQELEQFAYVASHDLQEPLQIVSNYAQLLRKRSEQSLEPRSLRYLHHIVKETKRMQQQINALLQYSRLNTDRKQFTLIDSKIPLDRAIANLQLKIKTSQAQIHLPKYLPEIVGDASYLRCLWQNLLGNAIKYRGDRPLEITVICQQQETSWLFQVKDNGIGIAPEHQKRIFRIFQRLHTQAEYPGTGIGLTICKRIVALHKGEIWVESDTTNGTTFYFTLPQKNAICINSLSPSNDLV